jgi:hypothetical protein
MGDSLPICLILLNTDDVENEVSENAGSSIQRSLPLSLVLFSRCGFGASAKYQVVQISQSKQNCCYTSKNVNHNLHLLYNRRRGMHIGYWWESQKERDH